MVNVEEEILHLFFLYLYYLQRVQSLSANDYSHRQRFCEWPLQRFNQNPLFHCLILMTDECCFISSIQIQGDLRGIMSPME
jgi:hypothetical protein